MTSERNPKLALLPVVLAARPTSKQTLGGADPRRSRRACIIVGAVRAAEEPSDRSLRCPRLSERSSTDGRAAAAPAGAAQSYVSCAVVRCLTSWQVVYILPSLKEVDAFIKSIGVNASDYKQVLGVISYTSNDKDCHRGLDRLPSRQAESWSGCGRSTRLASSR